MKSYFTYKRSFLPVILFVLMAIPKPIFAQNAGNYGQIRGFAYEKRTGEPLLFITLQLENSGLGAASDLNGYYSITKIPAGKYRLVAVSINHDTLIQEVDVVAGRVTTQNVLLSERTRELQAVEIQGDYEKTTRQTQVNISVSKILPRMVQRLPSVGGEADMAQYLQTIPGIVSTGDQGGQIFIRGGSNSQNLSLLDGMIVYNPFHSMGLFSVFDTDIMKSADVYTAGFNAEYGGRNSSVIDVRTIDGNKNNFSGKIAASPFAAKAMIECPIYKSKDGSGLVLLANHRQSYLHKTAPVLYPYAGDADLGLPFSFADSYAKLSLYSKNGSKISLSGFNFTDKARLNKTSTFDWQNYGAGANIILLPTNSSTLITAQFGYSSYKINISEASTSPRFSATDAFNGELNFTYNLSDDQLKYGFGVAGNSTNFTAPISPQSQQSFISYNTEFYSFARYRITRKNFVLEPSIRIQYYSSIAQLSPEPRIGAKYNFTENIRLKAAAGLYSQNILSTQSVRDVVSLFSGFVSSPEGVQNGQGQKVSNVLQKAVHWVAGIEYDLNANVQINVEPYIKNFFRLVNVNPIRERANDPDFVEESSLAKGIDFMVKYKKNAFSSQLGYSLAQVSRQFGGQQYYPPYDRRHNLNLLLGYSYGKKQEWDFDLRWNLGSGFPFTQTFAFFEDINFTGNIGNDLAGLAGDLGIYYGNGLQDYNRARLPYYHRLDLAAKRRFDLKGNAKIELSASLTNAYNRANLFYFDRVLYQRKNQLPLLPALGLNFSF